MTPVIKNARIAPLSYAQPLGPRRRDPGNAGRMGAASAKLDAQAPTGNAQSLAQTPGDAVQADDTALGLREKALRTPPPDSAPAWTGQPVPIAQGDAEAGHQSALKEAREPSERLGVEENNQQQCEQGYEQGYEQGLKEGLEQGRQQGVQEGRAQAEQEIDQARRAEASRALAANEATAKALQALHTQLQQADDALQAKAESLAVDLAWTALTRLLADAAGKREAVAGMVRAVLGETRSQEVVRIGLAAADLRILQAQSPSEFAAFSLVADARVQTGGCIVETVAGALDGRLETQLQTLRQVLLARQGSESSIDSLTESGAAT